MNDIIKYKTMKGNKDIKNKFKLKKNNLKINLNKDINIINNVKHNNIDKILKEKLEIINNNINDLNYSKDNSKKKKNKYYTNVLNHKKNIYNNNDSDRIKKNKNELSYNENKFIKNNTKQISSNNRINYKYGLDFNIYNKKTKIENEISLDSIKIQNFQKNKINYSDLSINKNSIVYNNDSKKSKEKKNKTISKNKKILSKLIYKKKKRKNINSFNNFNFVLDNFKKDRSLNKTLKYNEKTEYYVEFLKESLISNKDDYFNFIRKYHLKQNFNWLKKFNYLRKECNESKIFINFEINKKPIIFFDLDETLVHCSLKKSHKNCEIIFFNEKKLFVYKRPFLNEFLEKLSEKFNLILFTASKKIYAETILKLIDPKDKFFKLKLFRENCIHIDNGVYIKDLRIIKNINLKKCCIVDNSIVNFILQLENGIPIIPYFGNNLDNELKYLQKYLISLLNSKDITMINTLKFQFSNYLIYNDLDSLTNKLFLNN